MRPGFLILSSLLIMALLITPSFAATKSISYASNIPINLTDWDKNHTLPLFDPALGTLKSVRFYITINGTFNGSAENLGPSWSNLSFLRSTISMYVVMPDSPTNDIFFSRALRYPKNPLVFVQVSPWDGVTDYLGPDSFSGGDAAYSSQTRTYTTSADLAPYIATTPGQTLDFPCHTEGSSSAQGSGNFQSKFNTQAGSYALITYTYDDTHCFSGYKLNGCGNVGLSGWTITVNNSTKSWSATTDSNGFWRICNLDNGTYTVCETLQSGWVQTAPTSRCVSKTMAGVNITNTGVYKILEK